MAILEIKKFGDPILRKKAQKVERVDEGTKKLIVDIAQTIEKNQQGIGLAAPQVGVLKRIIVIRGDFEGPGILGLINPKIIKKSKETGIGEEGCLSFPGVFLKIKRFKEVEVEGLALNGEKITINATGILARVFQHEIDHLDGILFIDRINFWQRWKLKNKLKKVKL